MNETTLKPRHNKPTTTMEPATLQDQGGSRAGRALPFADECSLLFAAFLATMLAILMPSILHPSHWSMALASGVPCPSLWLYGYASSSWDPYGVGYVIVECMATGMEEPEETEAEAEASLHITVVPSRRSLRPEGAVCVCDTA
ncbi:hypothetical protein HYALB_00002623 [Hymenoscyphus albidus]|uniref:Uncharacterized protein n=1 Tax=Hymenoscyphus albidus TaxID=595503 RepID=A0A9N9LYK7_9HELO|nr:hypothetical protein HYALB_00002623 [Hymenoscyphus albidus]